MEDTVKTREFPLQQMVILAICRLCEPIAFTGIFPYVYFMIEDFQIASDENKISLYAGMLTSVFTLAEFSTGLLWGRCSDTVGRKPVLIFGMFGTALSVLTFGLAPNFTVALVARALGGLLNGNSGVVQTIVAELVTEKEHKPRAYTIMPLVWCIGSIIGPAIGGALAKPCESYPHLFKPGTIWDVHPYLLPNLLSATVVMLGMILGYLFLEETHANKKGSRDYGSRLGQWILSKAGTLRPENRSRDVLAVTEPEQEALLSPHSAGVAHGQSLHTSQPESAPPFTSSDPVGDSESQADPGWLMGQTHPSPTARIFNRQVILQIVSFGILAFHTMIFDTLFPIFLSTKPPAKHDETVSMPFKFVGGFGMSSKAVGFVLSSQGVYSLLAILIVVPAVLQTAGALQLFHFVTSTYFLLYFAIPYTALLPGSFGIAILHLILVWKCCYSNMAYPSCAILLAEACPDYRFLGIINGAAASIASLSRALGPLLAGIVYSWSLDIGYSGFTWWLVALISLLGSLFSFQFKKKTA